MKKKLLAAILATTMALLMTACGGSETTDTSNDATTKESSDTSEEVTDPVEETADDGIIDFEGDGFKVTYTKHETGTDYEGNPCLYYYFNFTNNGEEATSAMVASYIQCFQNGVECNTAITDEYTDEMDNYAKDVQPGTTIEVCEVFKLEDNSEVTLEASDWVSISDNKDVQKIALE